MEKIMSRNLYYILILHIGLVSNAFGYLDPSSMSLMWQFILAIFVGSLTAFSFIREHIKILFRKIFGKSTSGDTDDKSQE
jgi:hypothetical protein